MIFFVLGVKGTLIHPATQRHIEKYRDQPIYVINETQKLYEEITLPHICATANQFSLQVIIFYCF